ncbi:prostaglandin E2 receptor EP3 subtype isoform X2 [Scyliorhinus torazame]|uniref:prostaglandin E2 receptor EP3 subtype isoform X2 n=1 Tax=Scyliorhinus torazame TaxID=75743 RepID=UPI003B5C083E
MRVTRFKSLRTRLSTIKLGYSEHNVHWLSQSPTQQVAAATDWGRFQPASSSSTVMDLVCLHSQPGQWNQSAEESMWGGINSSSEQPNSNKSSANECVSVSVIFPVTMMVTGIVGNTLALLLVYRSYHKKENKRKRSFLLIIGALALTDLTGKLLTSPVVISVYVSNRQWSRVDPSGNLCAFFGVCMTTFGLCPLFLAGAMAIERTLAIHAPQYYSNHMTTRLTKLVVLSIWLCVMIFALLPIAGVGRYTLQWPGTWCFINTGNHILGNTIFASTFTVLGITSLLVTVSCNVATIRGLVVRCKKKLSSNKQLERITVETLMQLMGIMCVLCVCWSPLLNSRSSRTGENREHKERQRKRTAMRTSFTVLNIFFTNIWLRGNADPITPNPPAVNVSLPRSTQSPVTSDTASSWCARFIT